MKKKINGVLIIIGSSIGAGALGMPITCTLAGLLPSLITMLLVALYMKEIAKIIINLLILTKSDDLSIALKKNLSKKDYNLSLLAYSFLFTTITAAYISKSGTLLKIILDTTINININICYLIILLIVMLALNLKNTQFNYINNILTIILILIFILIITNNFKSKIDVKSIENININNLKYVYPILITSFGFHNILSYLNNESNNNKNMLYKTINIGIIITLLIYVVWISFILIFKNNYYKLDDINNYNSDKIITELLLFKNNKLMLFIINIFSLLAIITTIFSITLSMKFFFKKIFEHISEKIIKFFIIVPPIIIIIIKPNIFFTALEISGSILTLIIFGLMPIKAIKKEINTDLFKLNFLYIITAIIISMSIIFQIKKLL